MKERVTFIIPAYNEANNLRVLLPGWMKYCNEKDFFITIINDGSNDGTKELLDGFLPSGALKVIHHKVNRGYGASLKTGIKSAETEIIITIDADGQHKIADVENLLKVFVENDADMVIGSRKYLERENLYRFIGKFIIRRLIKILFVTTICDINSGLKIFRANLGKKYANICPNSMAFSDIFVLIFINQGNLVLEQPIAVHSRLSGRSTISTRTAFDTVWEILNITMLFNPLKIFLPLTIVFTTVGICWDIPIIFSGRGLSVGASLLILMGIIFLFLALIAEQISIIIKSKLE